MKTESIQEAKTPARAIRLLNEGTPLVRCIKTCSYHDGRRSRSLVCHTKKQVDNFFQRRHSKAGSGVAMHRGDRRRYYRLKKSWANCQTN